MQQFKQQFTKMVKPGDGKYFNNTTRGEDAELKDDLRSEQKEKKIEGVKKVIANMTMGKDVISFFPDVVNCMQTDNVELKKLVYLYLLSHAKSQPEYAIMAVNTFIKDSDDQNPLVRAAAIRTMSAIPVSSISDQLIAPLYKSLNDEDPYVRKTAALCVPKLFKMGNEDPQDSGFLTKLKELICDSNPMVLANAVAAITEITPDDVSWIDGKMNKLLTALNDCSEWGQVSILDAISRYEPSNPTEAQDILDRVSPRLCHANPAVVLSCINIYLKFHEKVAEPNTVMQRIRPSIITLLSSPPELQYVVMRFISLLHQKFDMDDDVKVFFVKFNDPIYVKHEKLDIMIRLTNSDNAVQVLAELKEYSKEVEFSFVRKAVRAIGRCAIKISSVADICVQILTDLIETKINYIVQEAVIVIKDIFRKYPNQYEKVISVLCDNLESLDEPEAKASIIFIVGEYAERIDNAGEILQFFLDGFADDNTQVQLQLLTAIVKLFLKRPSDTQDLVQSVLEQATQASDNPDLRDRGYIYWRLLSADPATAKFVVLAEKPLISEETDMLEPNLLNTLLKEIPCLSSVCHQPASSFVERRPGDYAHLSAGGGGRGPDRAAALDGARGSVQAAAPTVIPAQDVLIGDLLHMDGSNAYEIPPSQRYGLGAAPTPGETPDLLGYGGLNDPLPSASGQASLQLVQGESANMSISDALAEIFGHLNPFQGDARPEATFYEASPTVWLDRTGGLEVLGTFVRQPTVHAVVMRLMFTNYSLIPMTGFVIQFSGNSFGLAPAVPLPIQTPLLPQHTVTVSLPLTTSGPVIKKDPCMLLQVAMKNNVRESIFNCMVPLHVLFVEDGEMEKRVFLATWKDIPNDREKQYTLVPMNLSADTCSRRLRNNNIFTVASRSVNGTDMLYLSMKTDNIWIMAELKIQPDSHVSTLAMKSRCTEVYEPLFTAVREILKN